MANEEQVTLEPLVIDVDGPFRLQPLVPTVPVWITVVPSDLTSAK